MDQIAAVVQSQYIRERSERPRYRVMRKYRKIIRTEIKPADLIERRTIADERIKELRINSTRSEDRVIKLLDNLEYKYIFQYAIFNEWYFLIADFYIPKYKLIIEVDGPSHFNIESRRKEAKRKRWLLGMGIVVLRIKNNATIEMTERDLKKRITKVLSKQKKKR